MKRRDFIKSSAFAALASGLKRSAQGSQEFASVPDHADGGAKTGTSNTALGITPTAAEMLQANQWFVKQIGRSPGAAPFSFQFDGNASGGLLPNWPKTVNDRDLNGKRTQRTVTWTDPPTGLEVRCVAVRYSDFPVAEWTVYFKNISRRSTPILENIDGLDIYLERPQGTEFVLHQCKGDSDIPESYQPFSGKLPPNTSETFRPVGGRPTNSAFPYYNLQTSAGGVIIAIGWPGQWATSFKRDTGSGLRVSAGQELTRLYLKPDEEIRTPLNVLFFWRGTDMPRAQNLWRRWMLAHNLPRPNGKPPNPIFSFCDGAFFPGLKVDEVSEEKSMDVLNREAIKLDYWWLDAGWYPCGDNWTNTGTWEPDPARFPRGLKAVSDYVHARGTKLIVWFEPERVTAGSWLAQNHPEWLLTDRGSGPDQSHHDGSVKNSLLNLGNPEAREWLTNHIDRLITEQGIDLYRQDFNIDPLRFWRQNDQVDRQGMTENLHIQGYLAYWDKLRSRHPKMLIDSCASGGRRNDLETMRRAVPLLRSDYSPFDGNPASAKANQCQTYGLSSWIPYYGQGAYIQPENTAYFARSYMCPAFAMPVNWRKRQVDWELYRRLIHEWREIANCMLGDYYPLTEYSLRDDQWIGWQFDRPERGEGIVQIFRRSLSEKTSMSFRLNNIHSSAKYQIMNLATGMPTRVPGETLLQDGLLVEIQSKPGAAVLAYRISA